MEGVLGGKENISRGNSRAKNKNKIVIHSQVLKYFVFMLWAGKHLIHIPVPKE